MVNIGSKAQLAEHPAFNRNAVGSNPTTPIMKFENLTIYKEYPDHLCGRFPIRLYTSDFSEEKVRWHVGWPKETIPNEFLMLIETDLYIFGVHHCEIDNFYIFYTSVCTPIKPFPKIEINKRIDWMVRDYNKVLKFFIHAIRKGS